MIFRLYLCFDSTGKVLVGGDDENGPKRRVLRRLSPRYVSKIITTCSTRDADASRVSGMYFFSLY
jgi:hypothetical protein